MTGTIELLDLNPVADDMQGDVVAGLSKSPRALPSKYFYDARGSRLFERICEQPEYYLTRTELAIMREHAGAMARVLGPDLRVVEFGSGAGLKTRLLLDALLRPVEYVPVEISRSALRASVDQLAVEFPDITMRPVCADFTGKVALPEGRPQPRRTVVYFPGSTLGNFDQAVALDLLRRMRALVGDGGAVLLGLDRKKDPALIEAAYNDAAGVTAAFTLNMLVRFNRELGADFDLDGFGHRARYVPGRGRIETHLVSRRPQVVTVAGRRFDFEADEAMLVEYSCKYDLTDIEAMAGQAGLQVEHDWTDPAQWFSVLLLTAAPG